MSRIRIALPIAIGALALAALLLAFGQASAQPSGPASAERRYDWVEGVDDPAERDIPDRLSRPAPLGAAALGPFPSAPLPGPGYAVRFDGYPTAAEMATFLQQLETNYPNLVQVTQAGASWQGRPILAIRLGNEATGDPDTRPAFYLDGQHHAREAISAQVVAYFVWTLLHQYGSDPLVMHLLDTRTVYAIPMVNPDGNEIFLNSWQSMRKTANPDATDDDGDGDFDEDGPEGAGFGTFDVYHFTFTEDWVALHPGNPFVDGWASHLAAPRAYIGVFDGAGQQIPQIDNDIDGKINEDPPGGVDPNRNYDSHWDMGDTDPRDGTYRGPAPFSEPEARAVRDFVANRSTIALASSHHSGSDVLLHPWGWSGDAPLPDAFWYELMSRKGSELTEANGFKGSPHAWTARGLYAGSGSTMDWLYEREGILAWTPEVYAASSIAFVERIGASNTYSTGVSTGVGFNPANDQIVNTLDRWLRWNLYLLAATPSVDLHAAVVNADSLSLTIGNDGLVAAQVSAVVTTELGTFTATLGSLSAESAVWVLPFARRATSQTITVALTGVSDVGVSPKPQHTRLVTLEIAGDAVVAAGSALQPLPDLSQIFGDWHAAAQWDKPGVYHLGPALPLYTAGFEVTPTVGLLPLSAVFSNTSSGRYQTTLWEFGDTATAATPHATHLYERPGAFTVRLTVGGYGESATVTRTYVITVAAPLFLPLIQSP